MVLGMIFGMYDIAMGFQARTLAGQTNHNGSCPRSSLLTPEDRALSLHWRRSRSFCRMFVGVNTPNPAFSVDLHGQRGFCPMIRSQYELTYGDAGRVIPRQYLSLYNCFMRGFLGSPAWQNG
jgi:hypothetical protein